MAVRNANYHTITIYHRIPNSVSYQSVPTYARVRVATNLEKNQFQVLSGVISKTQGIHLYSQDLPKDIKHEDKVVFLGREYLVESLGVYLIETNQLGSHRFNPKHNINKAPKGFKIV